MARRILEDAMRARLGQSRRSVCVDIGTPSTAATGPQFQATPGFGFAGGFSKAQSYKEIKLDKYLGGTYALQYNYDGSYLAAGFGGGGIKLYNPITGEMLRELRPNRHGGYAVMCLRWHPKDPKYLYASTAEGHVYLINVETTDIQHIVEEPGNEINAMDFNLDGYYFGTAGKDLDVRLYQTKNNKLAKKYEGCGPSRRMTTGPNVESGNTMRVFALKGTSHSENIFLTAGWDNHIKIWDMRTNEGIVRQISGPHVCGDALDMQDRYILTGSWCAIHALQVHDYGEGKVVQDIPYPNTNGAFLYCAQFCDRAAVLAGGSGTNSVEALEVKGKEPKPQVTVKTKELSVSEKHAAEHGVFLARYK